MSAKSQAAIFPSMLKVKDFKKEKRYLEISMWVFTQSPPKTSQVYSKMRFRNMAPETLRDIWGHPVRRPRPQPHSKTTIYSKLRF